MSNPGYKLLEKRKKALSKKAGYWINQAKKLQTKYQQGKPRLKILIILISLALLTSLALLIYFLKDLPSPTKLSSGQFPTSTQIFDRHGTLLYEIYADQNRTPVELEQLPLYLLQATIAIEDKDFYKHHGLAFRGITRAIYKTIFNKELQGGSTITQQLVKTALLTPERTLKRKVKEAILASLAEIIYKKDDLLQMYLNHIPYGGTAYGIEQAAKLYFAKSAKDLNLAEAALLTGLPAAPTKYSPFGPDPLLAKERQNLVLKRMVEDGYVNQAEADQALTESLNYAPQTTNIKAPHFVMYVKNLLVEKYGSQLVEQGGLRVTTSLDWPLQKYSQQAVASETAKLKNMNVSNGAALVTLPQTGEILAMVGSKDYFSQDIDGNVNLTTSLRQPGSSIKPLNYATGLINGHTPATLFLDTPTCFTAPGQPQLYCPHNYDGKFHGPVTLRSALANSYNIPAVKMLSINGIQSFMATAKIMGITTWDENSAHYGLSLTLGGGEIKMTQMAVAFGVFSNMGKKMELTPILKVTDYQGKLYQIFNPEEKETSLVLSPAVSFLINDILSDNSARSPMFGSRSQLYIPGHTVAVKTGTTDHPRGPRDNWTIGYTPSYLAAVWVGNNNNSSMNPYLVSGVTGAGPIWNKIISFILKDKENEVWNQPASIIQAPTCNWEQPATPEGETAAVAPTNCTGRQELFVKGTETRQSPYAWVEKKEVWIDKETNRPPEEGKTDNLELREHIVGFDPFVKDYCLSCPHEGEKNTTAKLDENLMPTNITPKTP